MKTKRTEKSANVPNPTLCTPVDDSSFLIQIIDINNCFIQVKIEKNIINVHKVNIH